MTLCPSCGTENAAGTKFCVKCGAGLTAAPAPGSWEQPAPPTSGSSGNLYDTPGGGAYGTPSGGLGGQPGGYQPMSQTPAPHNYQQQGMYQQPAVGGSQPMHPAVPAIVSLILPGLGLLFVPDKAGLGIAIFVGWVVLLITTILLSFVFIGLCMIPVMLLVQIGAVIHSWDNAAKASNGQFQPILFK